MKKPKTQTLLRSTDHVKPSQLQTKTYIGTVETDFKHRFNNHRTSFNFQYYENDRKLFKEYKTIKHNNFTPKFTWRIISKRAPFKTTIRKCYLNVKEKLEITSYKGGNLLNQRSELILTSVDTNSSSVKVTSSNPLPLNFVQTPP